MQKPKYEQYVNMIRAEVWKKVKTRRLDFDELLSDGNLAFVEACQTWLPERGAFSTHLWYRLRFRLGQAYKISKKPEEEDMEEKQTPEEFVNLEDEDLAENGNGFLFAQLSELSQEAKYVIILIFSSGEELVDLTADHVRTTRKSIRLYLQSIGWSLSTIARTFDEIKELIS